MENEKEKLGATLFIKFVELIYSIAGIKFQENKEYFLSSKLSNRYKELGLSGFEEYYNYISSPTSQLTEFPFLLDEITVNETFFFRNQPQLELFENQYLKELVASYREKGKKKIRIWSCASSTGDEAYTTVMQILESSYMQGFEVEIIGTDICRKAVKHAQDGVYSLYSVRNIPENMMQKYFTASADSRTFTLSDNVKKMVTFTECNLMDASRIHTLGKFDIAFCRNVLIYFDDDSKKKALENIANTLVTDGFLVCGHSENLYSYRDIFKMDENKQSHIYWKAPIGTEKHNF